MTRRPADRFPGTWTLVSMRDLQPDGTVASPGRFGPMPRGLIVYTASGYVAVNFMRPGRSLWHSEETPSRDALQSAALGYSGYAGRWELDEASGLVLHHVDVALVPDRVGTTLARRYAFAGARLVLRPLGVGGAERAERVLVWERLDG